MICILPQECPAVEECADDIRQSHIRYICGHGVSLISVFRIDLQPVEKRSCRKLLCHVLPISGNCFLYGCGRQNAGIVGRKGSLWDIRILIGVLGICQLPSTVQRKGCVYHRYSPKIIVVSPHI